MQTVSKANKKGGNVGNRSSHKNREKRLEKLAETNDLITDPVDDGVSDESAFVDEKSLNDNLAQYKFIAPSIYGFTHGALAKDLNVLTEYLVKVGYTKKAAAERVKQWRDMTGYEDIVHMFDFETQLTFVDEEGKRHITFVHDTSFHKLLEEQGICGQCNQKKYTNGNEVIRNLGLEFSYHISREFYVKTCQCVGANGEPLTPEITENLLLGFLNNEIKHDFERSVVDPSYSPKYVYKDSSGKNVVTEVHFKAVNDFEPRPYQQGGIDGIVDRFEEHMESVLLWSPTRSGKSFTAMCAMDKLCGVGNIAVVVSGITDVGIEWQETLEAHKRFAGDGSGEEKKKRWAFLNAKMMAKPDAVEKAFEEADNVLVFLSQQDLNGSYDESGMKAHHQQLFAENEDGSMHSLVSYVVADECHFGAFSPSYGRAMGGVGSAVSVKDQQKLERTISTFTADDTEAEVEVTEVGKKTFDGLNPSKGKLFISATPFNIVASGVFSAAQGADNIVLITPQQIEAEAKQWEIENAAKPLAEQEPDWKNPSYGLVNKLFFGVSAGDPSKVFAPNKKDATKFAHHAQAKAILKSLFAPFANREDDRVPNLFANKAFLDTGCGKHIVLVMPEKKSCDAAEHTLKEILVNLGIADEYEILNIAPASKGTKDYKNASASEIKQAISDANERGENGKKTITLSVRKMLTGVTVREWDTLVMLTKVNSAQLQEQMMGRVNSPWIKTFKANDVVDEDGNVVKEGKVIDKVVLKQNSAIIHFAPEVVFELLNDLQYLNDKALVSDNDYNVGDDGELPDTDSAPMIDPDAMFSKIFGVQSGRMVSLSATDIRDVVLSKLDGEDLRSMIIRKTRFTVDMSDEEKRKIIARGGTALDQKGKLNKIDVAAFERADESNDASGQGDAGADGNNGADRADYVAPEDECVIDVCGAERDAGSTDGYCPVHQRERDVEAAKRRIAEAKKAGEAPDASDVELVGEADADAQREAKERKELEDYVNGVLQAGALKSALYVMISPRKESNLREVMQTLSTDENSANKDILESLEIACVLGVDKQLLQDLMEYSSLGSVDQTLHMVRMIMDKDDNNSASNINDDAGKVNGTDSGEGAVVGVDRFAKISRFLGDLGSISSNEVFTPYWVAEKVVSAIGFTDDELVDIVRSDETAGFISLGDKEAAFLVVMFNKCVAAIENVVSDASEREVLIERLKREKLYSVPTSATTFLMVRHVFKDYGFNVDNVLFVNDFDDIVGSELETNWSYYVALEINARTVDNDGKVNKKAVSVRDKAFAKIEDRHVEIISEVVDRVTEKTFAAAVGNPPYQLQSGENNDATRGTPIWVDFLKAAHSVSTITSTINPARWQKGGTGTGLTEVRDWLTKNKHFVKFQNFETEDVFPEAGFEGGVCIEVLDRQTKVKAPMYQKWDVSKGFTEAIEYNFNNGLDLFLDNPDDIKIIEKITEQTTETIEQYLKKNTLMMKLTYPEYPNGHSIITGHVKKNSNIFKTEPFPGSYKVLGLDNKEPIVRYVDKNKSLKTDFGNKNNTHKIVLPRTHVQSIYRNPKRGILSEDWVYAFSWNGAGIGTAKNAANFMSYVETYFFRYLSSLRRTSQDAYVPIYRWVPDLTTITNPRTGKVGYESDWTDDDLREVFKDVLTDEDWKHIKKTAIAKDGGRGNYEAGYELPKPFGWDEVFPDKEWKSKRVSLSLDF